eukprot:3212343-Pyramimonas_sp.AAC.1
MAPEGDGQSRLAAGPSAARLVALHRVLFLVAAALPLWRRRRLRDALALARACRPWRRTGRSWNARGRPR